MYKCSETVLQQFTNYLGNPQFSPVLPLIGLATGGLVTLPRLQDIDKKKRFQILAQNALLGGISGTGAELVRLGLANTKDHLKGDNILPGMSGWVQSATK